MSNPQRRVSTVRLAYPLLLRAAMALLLNVFATGHEFSELEAVQVAALCGRLHKLHRLGALFTICLKQPPCLSLGIVKTTVPLLLPGEMKSQAGRPEISDSKNPSTASQTTSQQDESSSLSSNLLSNLLHYTHLDAIVSETAFEAQALDAVCFAVVLQAAKGNSIRMDAQHARLNRCGYINVFRTVGLNSSVAL